MSSPNLAAKMKSGFVAAIRRAYWVLPALFLGTQSSAADLVFKKKIIEQCDEAKAELSRRTFEEQLAVISDLKLVLKLNLFEVNTVPDFGRTGQIIPQVNAPFDERKGDEIWRAFQPDREIKAKHCALELVKMLSPYSIDALPEMIELTQEHTLPHNVKNTLYNSMQSVILDSVNDDKFTIRTELVEELVTMLSGPFAHYAQNALIEMHKLSVPILFKKMRKPDGIFRDAIADTLLRLDDSGSEIGPGALRLLKSSDDGLRKRGIALLSKLESYYPFSLATLIESLYDISPEIQAAAVSALGEVFTKLKELPKVTLSDHTLDLLFRKFFSISSAGRKQLAPGIIKLLIISSKYEKALIKAYKAPDAELRSDILSVLVGRKLTPGLKNLVYSALKDPSDLVRLKALQVIASAKLYNSASFQALIRLYEQGNPQTKALAKHEILAVGKPIVPYLLKSVRAAPQNIELLSLLLKITPEDKALSKIFQSAVKNVQCEEQARLTVLAPKLTASVRTALLTSFTSCLNEPTVDHELIANAIYTLAPFKTKEQESLTAALKSNAVNKKALVFMLREPEKLTLSNTDTADLLRKLLTAEEKSIRYRAISLVNVIGPKSLDMQSDILTFKENNSDDDLLLNEAVLAISRIDENLINLEAFYYQQLDSDRFQWSEKYIVKLQPELALKIVKRALIELPMSRKHLAVRLAGELGKPALELLPLIKEHLEAADPALSYAATVALIKIDPSDELAAPALKGLLFREASDQLVKEDFDMIVLPLFDQVKTYSVSLVEKRMLDRLTKKIKG